MMESFDLRGRTLVIFGCGYVGAELARQARERGLQVTALTHNPDHAATLRAAGVTAIEADLADEGWHERLAAGADFAVNSVSSGRGGAAQRQRSYVDGMRSILAWARRAPVGTFVHLGSISVYPDAGGGEVDETTPPDGGTERARVQIETERLLREGDAWRRWTILRLAGLYGPGRGVLLAKVRAGEMLTGRPGEHLNLVHRDDVCRAIQAVWAGGEETAGVVFNVVDDGRATRGEIATWLAEWTGAPAPRFEGTPGTDRVVANARIKRVLGWRPAHASFREGYGTLLSR